MLLGIAGVENVHHNRLCTIETFYYSRDNRGFRCYLRTYTLIARIFENGALQQSTKDPMQSWQTALSLPCLTQARSINAPLRQTSSKSPASELKWDTIRTLLKPSDDVLWIHRTLTAMWFNPKGDLPHPSRKHSAEWITQPPKNSGLLALCPAVFLAPLGSLHTLPRDAQKPLWAHKPQCAPGSLWRLAQLS